MEISNPIDVKEVLETLKCFSKNKIPGPNGWLVNFFLSFFDLIGNDLVDVVNETSLKGKVSEDLNATFVALIPKVDKPISFSYFWFISLCNTIYKVIAKIIVNKMKACL